MSIYVRVDDVPGSATADGFDDHFKALSMDFGVARPVVQETGNMKNRLHGQPSFNEITLIKETDDSSSALFKQSLRGATLPKAEIKVTENDPDGGIIDYAVYELEDVIVSTFNMSASGDQSGPPTETVALSYSKLKTVFKGHTADQKAASTARVGYDLAKGKML